MRNDYADEKTKDMRLVLRYFNTKEEFDTYLAEVENKINDI